MAVEVGQRLRSAHVVEVLNRLVRQRGAPKYLFADNGSEFTGHLVDLWAYHHGTRIDFSRPGKPTDNAFIETFNGSLRDECLDVHRFEALADARRLVEAWRVEYNHASEHPSVYVIEVKRLCWSRLGPAGYLVFRRARFAIDLAASVKSSARAKIQGPSLKGWRASISPASAASRRVFEAIFRTRAASERLSVPALSCCDGSLLDRASLGTRFDRTRFRGPADPASPCEAVCPPQQKRRGRRCSNLRSCRATRPTFCQRELLVDQRTQLLNALRDHLAEMGFIAPQRKQTPGSQSARFSRGMTRMARWLFSIACGVRWLR